MEYLRAAVHKGLLHVADNVAKHLIQRAGWHEDDECFQVDLRQAEADILAAIQTYLEAPQV